MSKLLGLLKGIWTKGTEKGVLANELVNYRQPLGAVFGVRSSILHDLGEDGEARISHGPIRLSFSGNTNPHLLWEGDPFVIGGNVQKFLCVKPHTMWCEYRFSLQKYGAKATSTASGNVQLANEIGDLLGRLSQPTDGAFYRMKREGIPWSLKGPDCFLVGWFEHRVVGDMLFIDYVELYLDPNAEMWITLKHTVKPQITPTSELYLQDTPWWDPHYLEPIDPALFGQSLYFWLSFIEKNIGFSDLK